MCSTRLPILDSKATTTAAVYNRKWLDGIGNLNAFTSRDRDGDTLPDGRDGQGWTGPAEEWVNKQFAGTTGIAPVHIHQFDPRTGELVEEGEFHDLFAAPTTPVFSNALREHSFTQARLWRKIAGNLEESVDRNPPIGATRDNLIQNDMLVDRLRSPGGETLDRTHDGSNPIEGSVGYDPDTYSEADEANVGVRNDNKGFSIVRWATVRRGDNNPAYRDQQTGQIGAWMLSSFRDSSFNTVFHEDPFDPVLTIEDFRTGDLDDLSDPRTQEPMRPDLEVQETFYDLFNLNFNASVIQSIARHPRSKYQVADSSTWPAGILQDIVDDRYEELQLGANLQGNILHETDGELNPELINATDFDGYPRLADLLLAWGIGPTYTPDPTRTSTDVSFSDTDEGRRWITLPEALAIGLGFGTDQITYIASEPDADVVWMDTSTADESVLDDGHLRIDDYVAYLNANTAEDPPVFTVGSDVRRGTGAPLALGVVDQMRAIYPVDDNATSAELLATPTYGQININTAAGGGPASAPGAEPDARRVLRQRKR